MMDFEAAFESFKRRNRDREFLTVRPENEYLPNFSSLMHNIERKVNRPTEKTILR